MNDWTLELDEIAEYVEVRSAWLKSRIPTEGFGLWDLHTVQHCAAPLLLSCTENFCSFCTPKPGVGYSSRSSCIYIAEKLSGLLCKACHGETNLQNIASVSVSVSLLHRNDPFYIFHVLLFLFSSYTWINSSTSLREFFVSDPVYTAVCELCSNIQFTGYVIRKIFFIILEISGLSVRNNS